MATWASRRSASKSSALRGGQPALAQLMAGGRISLAAGAAAMLLSIFLGALVGTLAGFFILVFANRVDNALTHTPAEGRIHISLAPHGERAVEIQVQDSGKGIDAEELSRIFERFYQVDKSRARAEA